MNPTSFTPFTPMTSEQQVMIQQAQKAALQAATQQPSANLEQTQAQTGEAGAVAASAMQSAQTSAQERQNLQAQNAGIQADTQAKLVNLLQKKAQLNLNTDLTKNKMTLPDALKKYTSLGMHPDDIFTQYLSSSPYGIPKESPMQLQHLGISSNALGKIGDPGSFKDIYNTKNAIIELRGLEDTWKQTDTLSHIPWLGGADSTARAYNSQKQVVGEHLSSLIPGASNSQQSAQGFLDTLPNVGDLAAPGAATGQFSKVEQALLQSKGYKPEDLGLTPRQGSTNKPVSSGGGGLLSGLLGQALNPALSATNTLSNQNSQIPSAKGDLMQEIINAGQKTGNLFNNTIGNGQIIGQAATLAALPELASAGASIPTLIAKLGGKTAAKEVASGGIENLPGALKTFLNPKGAISQAGNVRNGLVEAASKAGQTINGDSLATEIGSWAQKAKMGNLGQGKAIDTAVTDAESIFKGKKLDPKDILSAYKEADSGYTSSGIAKTPIQANIDRGLRDVLGKQLDQIAPGWKKATTSMAKGYQAQKSPMRAGLKNLAKFGLPLAGAGAAGDAITHFLFPPGR